MEAYKGMQILSEASISTQLLQCILSAYEFERLLPISYDLLISPKLPRTLDTISMRVLLGCIAPSLRISTTAYGSFDVDTEDNPLLNASIALL